MLRACLGKAPVAVALAPKPAAAGPGSRDLPRRRPLLLVAPNGAPGQKVTFALEPDQLALVVERDLSLYAVRVEGGRDPGTWTPGSATHSRPGVLRPVLGL